MIEGVTSTGFAFAVDEGVFNDMELFDDLVALDKGDGSILPSLVDRLLGDQKPALYDHLRGENGRVPIDRVGAAILEIFRALNAGKNS